MSALPVLAADGLVYRYPHQAEPALRGVDLALRRGQAVGLIGPNGCGKSTLISLLVGVRRPQGGRLSFPGGATPAIAWVPQEYAFYPNLTCRENLCLFASLLDLPATERQARVGAALRDGQLQEFADRRARHCSGGVRRRLNLGLALLQRPDVLLLDEPTVGVDPQSRAWLLERVRALVQAGTAVLYATHYMEEARALCSDIVLLDQGRVIASGELSSLLRGGQDGASFADLEALFMHHTRRSLRD